MDREGDAWGEPYNLGPPVNSDAPEYYPSVTADGTLYFTREGEDRVSSTYRSRLVDGVYTEPELLPPQVNCGTNRFNVFVAPDETFVIVPAMGREDSLGGVDYYVVFRSDDDTWSEPINLGPTINQPAGREWSASLSPDGKYLFFMSSRSDEEAGSAVDRPLDHRTARSLHPSRTGQLGHLVGERGGDRTAQAVGLTLGQWGNGRPRCGLAMRQWGNGQWSRAPEGRQEIAWGVSPGYAGKN